MAFIRPKKAKNFFFAKSLRIVQFGEKSNKIFFVGLAFKAKTILAQGSKGLFYDENPFLSIKYSLYSNIRHTSFLKNFILYSTGSAYIGQLYDAKTGQLMHDRFLWENPVGVNEAIITSTETETKTEETLRDRMSLLDFSALIKATIIEFIEVG